MANAVKLVGPVKEGGDGMATEWFRIRSGKHAGRLHLSGWLGSAHLGVSSGPRDDGWLAFAMCPLCYAMVPTDQPGYGDLTWGHEQWHSRTDFPVPEELS